MPIYTAHFYTEADWAETRIKARTPARALAAAHRLAEDDPWTLDFQRYDSTNGVERIEILAPDQDTVAEWQSDELRLRLAVGDLLDALQQAVQALNEVPRFPVPGLLTDSYTIAATCDRAIAKAKGGAS